MTRSEEAQLSLELASGREAEAKRDAIGAARHWWQAWEIVKRLSTPELRAIESFDAAHPLLDSIHNWCQEFDAVLNNAARRDPGHHALRLRFATEFMDRFPDSASYLIKMTLQTKGESLWELGRREEAEATFAETIRRIPAYAGSYTGWADMYWLFRPKDMPKIHARAEELMQQALARDDLDDRDFVLERLEHLYEDWGKPEKRAEIAAQRARLRSREERPVSDIGGAPGPVGVPKTGRNDPCPCGSGKKFKKCCLGKEEREARERASSRPPPEWRIVVHLPAPKTPVPGTVELHPDVPRDLRRRLERARLENIALLRAMDRAHVYASEDEFSRELRAVFELEADCAEALWGLDQPIGAFSVAKMLKDTLSTLDRLPAARAAALAVLSDDDLRNIEAIKDVVVQMVQPDEAYSQVKGRDPRAGG